MFSVLINNALITNDPFNEKVHLDHGIVKEDIAEKCVIYDKSVYKVKKTLCKNDTFSRFCHALDQSAVNSGRKLI